MSDEIRRLRSCSAAMECCASGRHEIKDSVNSFRFTISALCCRTSFRFVYPVCKSAPMQEAARLTESFAGLEESSVRRIVDLMTIALNCKVVPGVHSQMFGEFRTSVQDCASDRQWSFRHLIHCPDSLIMEHAPQRTHLCLNLGGRMQCAFYDAELTLPSEHAVPEQASSPFVGESVLKCNP